MLPASIKRLPNALLPPSLAQIVARCAAGRKAGKRCWFLQNAPAPKPVKTNKKPL
jgi:hypothetical protein